ncbi:MAG: YkgJ family cysteine cluster protein [Acidobacteriota bacterium]
MHDPSRTRLGEAILNDLPRLDLDGEFSFRCGPQRECFNDCCADVNIVLTPYDVLRMKQSLGISSGDFLDTYTLIPFSKEHTFPVVFLKMNPEEPHTCPFVRDEGCTIYPDRPWACRMYPVGLAAPAEEQEERFYFLLEEPTCRGCEEGRPWTVRSWLEDQAVGPYDDLGEEFKAISLHPFFREGGQLEPNQMDMLFMSLYDLDRFRRFVFESSFLKRFRLDAEELARIRDSEVELLRLGFRWLRFCLLKEATLEVRRDSRDRAGHAPTATRRAP